MSDHDAGQEQPLTLLDWIDQTEASLGQGVPGTSASALVLEDRREPAEADR